MKILITGAAGFVGEHIFKRFAEHSLLRYDLVDGNDIRDTLKLDRLFETENFDAVINLAALAGVRRGEEFPEEYLSTNVIGLNTLIEVAEKYGVKKFIHFSSSSVYGDQDAVTGTKEEDEKNPRSVYGISKLAGELLLKKSSLPYIIIRPFTIIGEDGRKDMVIYKWLNQLKAGKKITFYGNGSSFRGYTYVGDIIDAVEILLNSDVTREDFNIGGHQKITLSELAQIFTEVFKIKESQFERLSMPKSDQAFSYANTYKARKLLGWEPKTDVKQKIKEILCLQ